MVLSSLGPEGLEESPSRTESALRPMLTNAGLTPCWFGYLTGSDVLSNTW